MTLRRVAPGVPPRSTPPLLADLYRHHDCFAPHPLDRAPRPRVSSTVSQTLPATLPRCTEPGSAAIHQRPVSSTPAIAPFSTTPACAISPCGFGSAVSSTPAIAPLWTTPACAVRSGVVRGGAREHIGASAGEGSIRALRPERAPLIKRLRSPSAARDMAHPTPRHRARRSPRSIHRPRA